MKNIFLKALCAELVIIVIAISSFVFIPEKRLAGFVAGCFFVGLGVWIFWRGLRDAIFRMSLTFWIGCVYLVLIALPLMIVRFANVSMAFEEVQILGLPGPVFHNVSTAIYSALMIGTIIDLLRSAFRRNKNKNPL